MSKGLVQCKHIYADVDTAREFAMKAKAKSTAPSGWGKPTHGDTSAALKWDREHAEWTARAVRRGKPGWDEPWFIRECVANYGVSKGEAKNILDSADPTFYTGGEIEGVMAAYNEPMWRHHLSRFDWDYLATKGIERC